jgi:hypothetical protein
MRYYAFIFSRGARVVGRPFRADASFRTDTVHEWWRGACRPPRHAVGRRYRRVVPARCVVLPASSPPRPGRAVLYAGDRRPGRTPSVSRADTGEVSGGLRAIDTAGLANDADAANQYAPVT